MRNVLIYLGAIAGLALATAILSACTTSKTIIIQVTPAPSTPTLEAPTHTPVPLPTLTPIPPPPPPTEPPPPTVEPPPPAVEPPPVQPPVPATEVAQPQPAVLDWVCASKGGCKCVPFDLFQDGIISYYEATKYGLTPTDAAALELAYEGTAGYELLACQP
jgi:type IV secretory pathway VirB10-like protein